MKNAYRKYLKYTVTALAALVALPLTVVAPQASADSWPYNSNFRPDKGYHNYCYSTAYPPTSAVRTQMYYSMVYMNNNTSAKRLYHSTCDLGGDGQTDIVWQETSPPSGAIGDARCVVKWSSGRCDRYLVRINGSRIRSHYSDASNRNRQYRKTSCHELGHTLGLDHYDAPYNSSCQRSGWTGTITSSWTRTWTAHHRGHINNWFG